MTDDQIAVMIPSSPGDERRYTDEELAIILDRAAERQEGAQSAPGRYTLAEIQEIAAGAGITADHVASVAASLRSQQSPVATESRGAPTLRFEETFDGEISDAVVGELLDLVRRDVGVQGTVTESFGTIQWTAHATLGSSVVSIARRGGRTTIDVAAIRAEGVTVVATLGGIGAFIPTLISGAVLIHVGGMHGPLVALSAIAAGASVSGVTAFSLWKRGMRRAAERTRDLGAKLAEMARRSIGG